VGKPANALCRQLKSRRARAGSLLKIVPLWNNRRRFFRYNGAMLLVKAIFECQTFCATRCTKFVPGFAITAPMRNRGKTSETSCEDFVTTGIGELRQNTSPV
jgi:hypothetical protein